MNRSLLAIDWQYLCVLTSAKQTLEETVLSPVYPKLRIYGPEPAWQPEN